MVNDSMINNQTNLNKTDLDEQIADMKRKIAIEKHRRQELLNEIHQLETELKKTHAAQDHAAIEALRQKINKL